MCVCACAHVTAQVYLMQSVPIVAGFGELKIGRLSYSVFLTWFFSGTEFSLYRILSKGILMVTTFQVSCSCWHIYIYIYISSILLTSFSLLLIAELIVCFIFVAKGFCYSCMNHLNISELLLHIMCIWHYVICKSSVCGIYLYLHHQMYKYII